MSEKTSSFAPVDNDQIRERIVALGLKHVAPETGPERHFLIALADPRRVSCPLEQNWIDCFHEFADGEQAFQPDPDSDRVVNKQKSSPGSYSSTGKAASLIDMAVVAANLGAHIHSIEQVIQDPLIREAIEMTTERSLDELAISPDILRGAVATAKGKYFELLVLEQINSGASVGDISLTRGQTAELANKLNQPGWDIAITDEQGYLADVVQLKATDSINYIKDALERYPDIKIIATSEATRTLDDQNLVIDSGISDQAIERAVGHAISHGSESFRDAVVDSFNPLFPLVFIVATEGYKVAVGSRSVENAVSNAIDRSKKSLTGGAVGAVFYAMGFGWVSVIPAVLAARAGPERMVEYIELGCRKLAHAIERFEKNREETKHTANKELPTVCAAYAKILNDRAKGDGINATFSALDIQQAIGSLGGFGLLNRLQTLNHSESLYFNHPAVRAAMVEAERASYELQQHQKMEDQKRVADARIWRDQMIEKIVLAELGIPSSRKQ